VILEWPVTMFGTGTRIATVDAGRLPGALSIHAMLQRSCYEEQWPHGNPPVLEIFERRLAAGHSWPTSSVWFGFVNGEAAGTLALRPARSVVAPMWLYVLPPWRKMGVAVRLLRVAAVYARKHGLRCFQASVRSNVPGGGRLAVHMDGLPIGRLRIDEVPIRPGSQQVVKKGCPSSLSITIRVFPGSVPSDSHLVDIARLRMMIWKRYGQVEAHERMSRQAALGRAQERHLSEIGIEKWTVCALDSRDVCIGFSEYMLDRDEPDVLIHTGLAVAETYRGIEVPLLLAKARSEIVSARQSIRRLRITTPRPVSGSKSPDEPVGGLFEVRWMVPLAGIERYCAMRSC
jgi:GNAT superfamily N-acetyltransferase